jgi:hypothetical protein
MSNEHALRELRDYIHPRNPGIVDLVAQHLPVVGVPELVASFLGELPPDASLILEAMKFNKH